MVRSPSHSGLILPLPGSPASSWAVYCARVKAVFQNTKTAVFISFWLLGLVNNVLYVIILSAAQDLVGNVPKGVVLLADVLPSFATKLVGPYFIHEVPYATRVPILAALSTVGMLLISITPTDASVAVKLVGVVLASLSSGGGEMSFLSLTHYYGPSSLAAWGSGTGAAGLVGAGLYVVMTDWLGLSVRRSLLAAAFLPALMLLSFFVVLPREHYREGMASGRSSKYIPVEGQPSNGRNGVDVGSDDTDPDMALPTSRLLSPILNEEAVAVAYATAEETQSPHVHQHASFTTNLRRVRVLFVPYMLPLLLVYVAEYSINQGVAPTLLFPLNDSPFSEYRDFYPFYGFLYQLGVFISRSSTPFYRMHHLYLPSLLQVINLAVLICQALYFENFLPSVYFVFFVIFWEGLLGGAVYVNTFHEIMEHIPAEDREFSLGATTVSDSGGICIAGLVSMIMEVGLCNWQVRHGRNWCREMQPSSG